MSWNICFFKYCTKIREKYVKFVFTDAKKRSRYDSGVDLEDLEGHGHGFGGDIDPNQVFQAFFGGGAGRCCGRTMYCWHKKITSLKMNFRQNKHKYYLKKYNNLKI